MGKANGGSFIFWSMASFRLRARLVTSRFPELFLPSVLGDTRHVRGFMDLMLHWASLRGRDMVAERPRNLLFPYLEALLRHELAIATPEETYASDVLRKRWIAKDVHGRFDGRRLHQCWVELQHLLHCRRSAFAAIRLFVLSFFDLRDATLAERVQQSETDTETQFQR